MVKNVAHLRAGGSTIRPRWPDITLILVICTAGLMGCRKEPNSSPVAETQPAPQQQHLNVAAAADLKFALDEASAIFRRSHPQANIRITYGSSGNFFAQITNKAPFDLFLSADRDYPRRLVALGLADERSEFTYAVGRIVLWVPNSSNLDISKPGLEALADPSVKKIAIANPQHAPYGRAAEAALRKQKLWDKLQDTLVLGENIGQAAQFVESGSADVGVLALSLALSPQLKASGRYSIIPQNDYPTIEQAGVVLSYAAHPQTAELFRQFLCGTEGQALFARYGFETPARPSTAP